MIISANKIQFILDTFKGSHVIISDDYPSYFIDGVEFVERPYIYNFTNITKYEFQNILINRSKYLNALDNRLFRKKSMKRGTRFIHIYSIDDIIKMNDLT